MSNKFSLFYRFDHALGCAHLAMRLLETVEKDLHPTRQLAASVGLSVFLPLPHPSRRRAIPHPSGNPAQSDDYEGRFAHNHPTVQDCVCILVAALCRGLGHAPYSDLWAEFSSGGGAEWSLQKATRLLVSEMWKGAPARREKVLLSQQKATKEQDSATIKITTSAIPARPASSPESCSLSPEKSGHDETRFRKSASQDVLTEEDFPSTPGSMGAAEGLRPQLERYFAKWFPDDGGTIRFGERDLDFILELIDLPRSVVVSLRAELQMASSPDSGTEGSSFPRWRGRGEVPPAARVAMLWTRHIRGRPVNLAYAYEIVHNWRGGLDADLLDCALRDSGKCGLKNTLDVDRWLQKLCGPDKHIVRRYVRNS